MRKIFQVFIMDKEYDVYDIDNKKHEGYNGVSKTWWIYYSDRLPDELLPSIDSEYLIPYHVSISRLVWDIRFTQRVTTKEKWNRTQFNNNTKCEMWCNGKLIYSFNTIGGEEGMNFAIAKAQYLQQTLFEHPFNFLNPDKEQSREIWFYGLPATINLGSENAKWEIQIIPDYSTGVSKEQWWKEFKHITTNLNEIKKENDIDIFEDEYISQDYINWGSALEDSHINWFRK